MIRTDSQTVPQPAGLLRDELPLEKESGPALLHSRKRQHLGVFQLPRRSYAPNHRFNPNIAWR